jgi:hypothetical protein
MRWAGRMMLIFIGFDQEGEQLEAIGFGRALLRLANEVPFNLNESCLVFGFGADGAIDYRMVSGSIRSYSALMPTNFQAQVLRPG